MSIYNCETMKYILLFFSFFITTLISAQTLTRSIEAINTLEWKDILDFNAFFFSQSSVKTALGFLPLYLIARPFDHKINRFFYDQKCHKNKRQLPQWCNHSANVIALAVPMVTLAGCALFAQDYTLRTTAQVFILGLPFTWATKRILKCFETRCCERPKNEHFPLYPRAYGGFPSGHMLEATYMATLLGLQCGAHWGIPLGVSASLLGIDFLVCNRHYLSQLIAGVALGVMYGIAAHKLASKKIVEHYALSIQLDANTQRPLLEISYAF
jgi:membrane-associated phospholipid phosphatase